MAIDPEVERLIAQAERLAGTFATDLGAVLTSLRNQLIVAPPPPPPPPPPTGIPTISVRQGDNLQQILDNVDGPAIIRLQPVEFKGNFRLRKKNVPENYRIILRSDVDGGAIWPTGKPWVQPSQSSAMAKLVSADGFSPALAADDGANRYYLLGLEFPPNTKMPDRDLVEIGRSEATSLDQLPENIEVDQCYFHGHPDSGGHRGLSFNVKKGRVRSCYFEKFIEPGRDSQALWINSGVGPYLIEKNYFEATGENLLVGGADVRIANLVPSDIVIRGNYLFKPLSWQLSPKQVKNLFELKNARRVLIENNVFENCWPDAQAGHGVVFTIRNQDGGNPWATVDDVVFQYNIIRNTVGTAMNMLGQDYLNPSARGKNVVIQHNLMIDTSGIMMSRQMQPTKFLNNSILGLKSKSFTLEMSNPLMDPGMLVIQNNVISDAMWGPMADGQAPGTTSLNAFARGLIFDHNVIENTANVPYPPNNTILAGGLRNKLQNYKYIGGEVGSDGKPVGCDVDELRRRIPWYTF